MKTFSSAAVLFFVMLVVRDQCFVRAQDDEDADYSNAIETVSFVVQFEFCFSC